MPHPAPVAKTILTFCTLIALGGCGLLPEDTRPKNHAMRPPFDLRGLLNDESGTAHKPVSVYDAIALGLRNDLDRRAASLEQGALIPASYTPDNQTPWAALDTGIGYARGKALPGYDYQRKAAAEIVQDVRYAWARAASAVYLKNDIDAALAAASAYLTHNPDPGLQAQMEAMSALKAQLDAAPGELAALTGAPARPLDIAALAETEKSALPALTTSVEELEIAALLNRPEIRNGLEDGAAMSVAEIRDTVLKTFPNMQDILRRAAAPEKIPGDAMWKNFSTSFTQSLIRVFTLPLRLEDEQNRRLLASLRQQALSAAILAQVHLAHDQYRDAHQKVSAYRDVLDRVDAAPPITAESAALRLALTRTSARARLHLAQAELLTATARLMEAVGLDLLPEDVQGLTPQMMAEEVRKRLKSADYALLDALVARIDEHKAPVPSPGNHAILAAEKLKAGIEPAVYRQDQGVTMSQASLSRPAFLIPSTRIPPAQKVPAKILPPGFPAAAGEPETLRMPERQTRALLEAPVSDAP